MKRETPYLYASESSNAAPMLDMQLVMQLEIHQLQTDTQPTQVMIRLKELAIIIGAGCFYNHQAKGVGFVVYY